MQWQLQDASHINSFFENLFRSLCKGDINQDLASRNLDKYINAKCFALNYLPTGGSPRRRKNMRVYPEGYNCFNVQDMFLPKRSNLGDSSCITQDRTLLYLDRWNMCWYQVFSLTQSNVQRRTFLSQNLSVFFAAGIINVFGSNIDAIWSRFLDEGI